MRSLLPRLASAIVVGLSVIACATAMSPAPITTSSPSAEASATPNAAGSAGPLGSPSASPTLPPAPGSGSLPIRVTEGDPSESVTMVVGPDGLHVSVAGANESVVALLDSSGKPRSGWPIALDGPCDLPAPASDGSIRLICRPTTDGQVRAHAFTPDGRPVAGWPVDLPAGGVARVAGQDLYVMTYVDDNELQTVNGIRLLAVAPDGAIRTGTSVTTPDTNQQEWRAQLGPDGTGYVLAFPNSVTGDTEITAFDLTGSRKGWPAHVRGWFNDLSFGPEGRIYATESHEGQGPSRTRVFDRDGRSLPIGSDPLPVAATGSYAGAGPFGGAPPPVVAEDGTSFLVSEDGGTTVYGLDATGRVMTGWPYRDTVGLRWTKVPPGDVGSPSWRSDPAVGPDGTLYLIHPPREASLGGSIVAIGPDGRIRAGWPVGLTRRGAEFTSLVVAPDGTAYALAVEPEGGGRSSATILAIAPDSTIRYTTTIIDP